MFYVLAFLLHLKEYYRDRSLLPNFLSPRVHLHVVGMLRFMSDINQPSLPTPFYSVRVSISVFMALSTVFHFINSPDNSPRSLSALPVSCLLIGPFNCMSLYEFPLNVLI